MQHPRHRIWLLCRTMWNRTTFMESCGDLLHFPNIVLLIVKVFLWNASIMSLSWPIFFFSFKLLTDLTLRSSCLTGFAVLQHLFAHEFPETSIPRKICCFSLQLLYVVVSEHITPQQDTIFEDGMGLKMYSVRR